MRIEDKVLAKIVRVVILEDASDLNIGKRERLGQILQPFCFDDGLVKNPPIEVSDRPVRPDRARPDPGDVLGIFKVRNLYVGILSAFSCQDLDSEIIILMRRAAVVISINLPVKNDGRSAGSLRLARHLQFVRRHGLKSNTRASWRRECNRHER